MSSKAQTSNSSSGLSCLNNSTICLSRFQCGMQDAGKALVFGALGVGSSGTAKAVDGRAGRQGGCLPASPSGPRLCTCSKLPVVIWNMKKVLVVNRATRTSGIPEVLSRACSGSTPMEIFIRPPTDSAVAPPKRRRISVFLWTCRRRIASNSCHVQLRPFGEGVMEELLASRQLHQ